MTFEVSPLTGGIGAEIFARTLPIRISSTI